MLCELIGRPHTAMGQVITITSMSTVSAKALMSEQRLVIQSSVLGVHCAKLAGQIMLRNIPNKVDQAMLKRIVDESSWGKYDFMYLRIDFANDCK